jgi:hypothetical protein
MLLLMALGISACAPADLQYRPAVGVSALREDVDALSLTVVTNGAGVATLVGTLLNEGPQPDSLIGVSAFSPLPAGSPVTATLTHGPVPLPVGQPIELAPISAVTLTSADFPVGYALNVTLTFARSGQINLLVLIYPQDDIFDEVKVPASAPPN